MDPRENKEEKAVRTLFDFAQGMLFPIVPFRFYTHFGEDI